MENNKNNKNGKEKKTMVVITYQLESEGKVKPELHLILQAGDEEEVPLEVLLR